MNILECSESVSETEEITVYVVYVIIKETHWDYYSINELLRYRGEQYAVLFIVEEEK